MSVHAESARAVVREVGEVREWADFDEVKVANGLARAVKMRRKEIGTATVSKSLYQGHVKTS